MKFALSLGLIVAAASLACSSDEGTDRNAGGTGGTGTASAGTGGTGTANAGTGGTGGTSAGGSAGGTGVSAVPGEAFTIDADGNVVDSAGNTGVNGGTFLTQSMFMTVDAATGHREGGLCFSGTTAVVPDSDSYGTYWGAELGLNLKLIPDPAAPAPAADAGADAGAGELVPAPWPYGDVIGFSFKLVGNDPAAADKGVPASRIRFKALPDGSDGSTDNYCKDLLATADGQTVNVLFSEVTFECWAPGSLGVDGANINRITATTPARIVGEVPNPKALQNISWQIASDVLATTPAPIAFNFCIEDLKPLRAAP